MQSDRDYVIPAPKLTDIILPALGTGQAQWVDKLWNLKETKGVIKVMHLCDIHFPFQHVGALNIAYQLVEMVKPDVIVDGSDIGDFAMLSAFDPDPDVEDEEVDTLDDFEALYAPHEYMLNKLAPRAVRPWIYGNHDWRIITALKARMKKMRKRVMRDYIHILTAQGALYMGDMVDAVRMGPLVVCHGSRFGATASAQILKTDFGSQVCVGFGHTHKINETFLNGEDFNVWAKGSGCLTRKGHYIKGRGNAKDMLGTQIFTVDLNSRECESDNLVFNDLGTKTVANYQGRRLEAASF